MQILRKIPIDLDIEQVKRELHSSEYQKAPLDLSQAVKTARSIIRCQAIYKASYIDHRNNCSVKIDGVTFTSRVLRVNLEKTERVFPFLITIGRRLEKRASSSKNLLEQFYLETLGDMALHLCMKHLEKHLKRLYSLEKLGSMSPGTLKDWPLEEQKLLFSLFHGEENLIGVKLMDNMLMIPRKSLSGICFPTEETFFTCQLCPRERCPSRKAPYEERQKEKAGPKAH